MSFYILNENFCLRSYELIPWSYYHKGDLSVVGLHEEEFELLKLCDGLHNIKENDIILKFLHSNVIKKCQKGEFNLTPFQEYKDFKNRYVPKINLQITSCCNFDCLHCFNASSVNTERHQLSLEQLLDIINQAKNCGVHSFTITGGEPLIHKDFYQIIEAIYKNDMSVFDFNTNGAYVDQKFIDFFKALPFKPLIKISFDGLEFHDFMRNKKGAEKEALDSIKLCVKNGFRVMVQYNINKKNISTFNKSLELLDSLGVETVRVIRTTEVPRIFKNYKNFCLTVQEYYDFILNFLHEFVQKPHNIDIIVWQFLTVFCRSKTFSLTPISRENNREYIRLNQPICKGNRGMLAISANGNVYPCMQMSGGCDMFHVYFGNVFKDGLYNIFQTNSKIMTFNCTSVLDRAMHNKKCLKCKYLLYCGCGCPALSMSNQDNNGSLLEPDDWKCIFFFEGYYEKTLIALKPYRCTTLMKDKYLDEKVREEIINGETKRKKSCPKK